MAIYMMRDGYVIELSSDLRGATLAWLQAQWWTDIYGTWDRGYTLDSSWFYPNRVSNNRSAIFRLVSDIASMSKVKIHCTWILTRNHSANNYQYCSYVTMWLYDLSGGNMPDVWNNNWLVFKYNASNPYNTSAKSWIYYGSTLIWNEITTHYGGTVDFTAEIDLQAKTVLYKITSPVSATVSWTLTDAQIASIWSYPYVWVMIWHMDPEEREILYTAELLVED